jgi:hypothetical protein
MAIQYEEIEVTVTLRFRAMVGRNYAKDQIESFADQLVEYGSEQFHGDGIDFENSAVAAVVRSPL